MTTDSLNFKTLRIERMLAKILTREQERSYKRGELVREGKPTREKGETNKGARVIGIS